MEKMDTDGLPDYQDNTDDNDAYCSNTAKKARLSSHNSLSNTEPSPSNSLGPCTSQIYTGNFVETNLAVSFISGFVVLSLRQVNLFLLRFYGPINPMGSCRARSVYLTTSG